MVSFNIICFKLKGINFILFFNCEVPTDSGICHTFNGVALSKILKPSSWFSDFRWYQYHLNTPFLSRYLRAMFTQWCFQTCRRRGALGSFQVTGNRQRGGLRILHWYHAGVFKYLFILEKLIKSTYSFSSFISGIGDNQATPWVSSASGLTSRSCYSSCQWNQKFAFTYSASVWTLSIT